MSDHNELPGEVNAREPDDLVSGGQSILVIDDNVLLLRAIGEMLELEGWNVTLCTGGPMAIQQASHQSFDTILIDFNMPGIRGHMVAETLRALLPAARIIGTSFQDHAKEFLAAGADGFLLKPFDVAALGKLGGSAGA